MKSFDQIISELKRGQFAPVYFLMGEESYFIDKITSFVQDNILSEAEKSFDQTVLYGKDTDIVTIINIAKRFPMMSTHQVVIVKEAQNLKSIDELSYYLAQPQKSTILLFSYKYGKLNKNKKIFKELDKKAVVFESNKLYENMIPAWIKDYLSLKKIDIQPESSALLVEYLGDDLSKIAGELDKLIITLPENERTITKLHIERNIGISKDFNNFELHKALGQKNIFKANQIIQYFEKNPRNNPINVTISLLYYFFSRILLYHFEKDKSKQNIASVLKINPYFLKDYTTAARNYSIRKVVQIIALLREYDLRSKGVNNLSASEGDLLKELTYKILH